MKVYKQGTLHWKYGQ